MGQIGSDEIRRHGGIYFVTSKAFGLSHADGAQAALRGGVRIIQYREKEASARAMIEEASAIKKLCKDYGALFIIDDRLDVALEVDPDGVHLGQEDAPLGLARRLFPDKIVGISAKTPEQAAQAQRGGASYLGVGAVYPTSTKVKTVVIGVEGFAKVRKSTSLPVYAIGGLKPENMEEIKRLGGDGAAVITAILGAENPSKAAQGLVRIWEQA